MDPVSSWSWGASWALRMGTLSLSGSWVWSGSGSKGGSSGLRGRATGAVMGHLLHAGSTVREPRLHGPPSPPLLAFQDAFVVGLEVDDQPRVRLDGVVELQGQKVVRLRQLLHEE